MLLAQIKSIIRMVTILLIFIVIHGCNDFQPSETNVPQRSPRDDVQVSRGDPDASVTSLGMTAGQNINIAYLPDAGAGELAKFASDDPSVASIDSNGNINAIASGQTTIHIVYVDGSTARVEVEVITTRPNSNNITVGPP